MRRGFVFMVVLMVIVIGTITIGATVSASSFKSRVNESRVRAYRTQHEALSVRDIIRWWLMQMNNSGGRREAGVNPLMALDESPESSKRFTLESGVVIRVTVRDAQGTMLARLDDSLSPENFEWLFEALKRLPQERVDLIRRHGPLTVSLRSATDEVLGALAEGDAEMAEALIDIRGIGVPDPATFAREMNSRGFDTERTQQMLRRVTITPTLWKMDVEVIDPNSANIRRYTMIVEQTSTFPIVHRWGPYEPDTLPRHARR